MADTPSDSNRAPNRAERKMCWDSRDAYWACMDRHGQESNKCDDLKKLYETACPAQWVKHFDRKYVYEQYKKRIEKEGYEPIPAPPAQENVSNKSKEATDPTIGKPGSS